MYKHTSSNRCKDRTFKKELMSASVIIPFYNEWPSLLLRTIYSVINRSPRKWLQEIILVDDGSTMGNYFRFLSQIAVFTWMGENA